MKITSFELVELDNILIKTCLVEEKLRLKSTTHIPYDELAMMLGSLLQGDNYILLDEELFEALSERNLTEIMTSNSKVILCRNGGLEWLERTYYFIERNYQLVEATNKMKSTRPTDKQIIKKIFDDWDYNNIRRKKDKK